MPSGITHILLAKYLQEQQILPILKTVLAASRDYFQIGSVAPDLPYASIADDDLFFKTQSVLADKFHYVKTNELPILALQKVKQRKATLSSEELRSHFSFFAGYMAHIVADGIVHPFVRDKVGNYKENQSAHRILEMQLDVVFYHYLVADSGAPGQFNNSNMHDELANLDGTPGLAKVTTLFSDTIQEVYDLTYAPEDIQDWIKGLHRMFNIAQGLPPLMYNLPVVRDYAFADFNDLKNQCAHFLNLQKPKDRDTNFLNRANINFIDDLIPKYYVKLRSLLERAYDYVYGTGNPLTLADLPPIDLDTGRSLADNNDLSKTPSLWA